jgi:eukaryotic-like serine/threonine-protein kinase
MADESGGRAPEALSWQGLAPGMEVAGFTVEELLASGSFGTVYRARRGGRPFALKLVGIEPRGDREVEALRLMRHPNVVSFHGYGFWPEEQPRFLVLALELVEGRPLDVWAQEENPSALELVMRVLLPLALTLADVHEAGVVHRDIKEANIIVREADGQPVLVDFGAAGFDGARRLTKLLPPGTPEYRAPEAWRFAREWEGEPYPFQPSDDLWALGIVTYLLLTRTLPFGDRHDSGMVRAVLEVTPHAPHEHNRRVPLALSELCLRMLEKRPESRFADAKELAAALSAAWARADRSWRVPLFPEDSRPKRRAAPAKREGIRWGLRGGVVLVALVGLLEMYSLFIGRERLSASSPPPQASPRQELAPKPTTGEVGSSAGPLKSPTPAPAASAASPHEDPPKMKLKSKTLRTLTVAGCMAGSACASGPQQRQPPKPADCPRGSEDSHMRLNIGIGMKLNGDVGLKGLYEDKEVPARDGAMTLHITPTTPLLRELKGATVSGRLFVTSNRIYGHFTEVHLASGETLPVCLELSDEFGPTRENGSAFGEGSTPGKPLLPIRVSLAVVTRFH